MFLHVLRFSWLFLDEILTSMQASANKGIRYEFGRFVLDPDDRSLLANGSAIHLPRKEFDTLVVLVENAGRALSKEELMNAVWGETFVEEVNLAKQISRLRKLLGGDGVERIETIPKHGYRFSSDVRRRTTVSDGIEPPPSVEHHPPPSPSEWLRIPTYPIAIACGAFLVGLILLATFVWKGNGPSDASNRSIAILPIQTFGEEEATRMLAAGLTDSLTTKLGSSKLLIVRPGSSVRSFTSNDRDPIKIGRDLDVKVVLDGTVLRSDDRVRVNLRLIDPGSGEQFWSEKFDGSVANMFELEDRISEVLIRAVVPDLPASHVTLQYTADKPAYESYLKGRYFLAKRTEEGFRQAIQYFDDAVARDPNFVLAHVGIADANILLGVWGSIPPNDVFPLARQAAEKALSLDPKASQALVSLAFVEWVNSWDFNAADKHFREAIDLDPNYATAHHWYAYYLVSMGRSAEAISEIRRARELEGPLTLSVNTDVGEILSWAGRYEEAEAQFAEIFKIEPNYAIGRDVRAINLLKLGRIDEAVSELEKARALESSPRVLSVLAFAHAAAGNKPKAAELIKELEVQAGSRYVSPFSLAVGYTGIGNNARALDNLEKALAERSDTMAILNVYPLTQPLRTEPRFRTLLQKIGYR
jgi:DNA-binding winged helix-turn-helix (wHTH) protein/TolB-like protein/Tfp pilus assembly protein PilF